MSRCSNCGFVECRNGPSCKYLFRGNCSFCHCSDADEKWHSCSYCDATFHRDMQPWMECVECEQMGCDDCINATCEGCAGAVHYDGEGGDACAPFVDDRNEYVLCTWCSENRQPSSENDSSNDSEVEDSENACPDCGYELGEYVSLDEHRTEGEGSCGHLRTNARGEREICFCCGEDLGYWQTNEEFYDTIGAPYDDRNP